MKIDRWDISSFGTLDRFRAEGLSAHPLVVLLDDLHRADAATVKLLEHVLAELPRLPLQIVAAYRPDGPFRSAEQARRAAETLQRDLAPHTDLAGYLV